MSQVYSSLVSLMQWGNKFQRDMRYKLRKMFDL